MIRERVLTSVELVQACLARVREVDGQVQAWTFLDPECALAQARAADEDRMSGHPTGALHGVPVGLKDIIDTVDMPTGNGSVLHARRTPSHDASVVSRLPAAGAVIMGKTVTTEFATRTPGKTRNPHNSGHTPGGSSSGSAAAVAAGMVQPALGSQTTGSTVRPASYCGVYGLKPTHGLVPRHGMLQALANTRSRRTLRALGRGHRAAPRRAGVARRARSGLAPPRPRSIPSGGRRGAAAGAQVRVREDIPMWDRVDADARRAFEELVARLGDRVEALELVAPADEVLEWQRAIGAPRSRSISGRAALRRDPDARRVRHGSEGARVDRRSGVLRAVDPLRDAGAQRSADAGDQRPAARSPAGRRPPRRCSASTHRALAREPPLERGVVGRMPRRV